MTKKLKHAHKCGVIQNGDSLYIKRWEFYTDGTKSFKSYPFKVLYLVVSSIISRTTSIIKHNPTVRLLSGL